MTTQPHRPSAEIYAFPAGGRAHRSRHRQAAKPAGQSATSRIDTAACNSSWYHGAAVAESEQSSELANSVHLFTDRY